MAIITNYPNVPIVTSNVATDSVRNDNEHKSSVSPTDKVTKPHEERAIDPEKEHDAQQQHHQQNEQTLPQADDEQSDDTESLENKPSHDTVIMAHAALTRKDIKVQANEDEKKVPEDNVTPKTQNAPKSEDASQMKKNLTTAYQSDSPAPKTNAKINDWT